MKITVIAATGHLGKVLTRKALDAGHHVTALVRTPEKLGPLADEVHRTVQGSLTDPAAIDAAIEGSDAVIWCAGPTKGSLDPAVFGEGMARVLESMRKHDVARIVAISGASTPMEGDDVTFGLKFTRLLSRLVPIPIVECNVAMRDPLLASDREWIYVRSANMKDGPPLGNFRAGNGYQGWNISRSELADFMLEQLESDEWLRKSPIVASG